MNWLDTILVITFVASMAQGFSSGIVKVAISFISLFAAVVLSMVMNKQATDLMLGFVDQRIAAAALGYALVFTVVLIVGGIITWMVQKALDVTGLRIIDRVGGLIFGGVRAGLLGIALVTLIVTFSRQVPPPVLKDSQFAPYMIDAGKILIGLAPDDVKQVFEKNYALVKNFWQKTSKAIDAIPVAK
jgi:membrane protein required for colicin V production